MPVAAAVCLLQIANLFTILIPVLAQSSDLGSNLSDLVARYGEEVMIVELGGEDNKPKNTYDMLVAAQQKVKAVPNNKGLGVIYWEPEGARSWSHYALSAWGDNGKPTKALEAFLRE